MRILLHGLLAGNRSGTGRYITELLRAFSYQDHGPEVVCLWPKHVPAPSQDVEASLVRVSDAFPVRFWTEQCLSPRYARSYSVDLVHFPAGIAGRCGKIPSVVTVHDLCGLLHPEWFPTSRVWYYRLFMGSSIYKADHLITDSQAVADDIIDRFGIDPSKISVVPLGVNPNFRPASEAQKEHVRNYYKLPPNFFLFVGTLEPRKNLRRLVQAWSLIPNDRPDLVIAGREGWKTSVDELRLLASYQAQRLHFIGHVADDVLPALISAATAFVWPSLMEGFGLPPLEAMACGTPVITSNTSCLPETVGEAAILVNPLDTEALASAMRQITEDSSLHVSLSKTGINHAAGFTWQRTAALTFQCYCKVVA